MINPISNSNKIFLPITTMALPNHKRKLQSKIVTITSSKNSQQLLNLKNTQQQYMANQSGLLSKPIFMLMNSNLPNGMVIYSSKQKNV